MDTEKLDEWVKSGMVFKRDSMDNERVVTSIEKTDTLPFQKGDIIHTRTLSNDFWNVYDSDDFKSREFIFVRQMGENEFAGYLKDHNNREY
jgi:hypothetical protein